ncbi:MAG: RsmE family RNA methyltransferase [Treponema sp.]|nr:RsmE family RNA methyltransferase [Treponema sp.]
MRQFLLDVELAPFQKLSVTGKDFKYLAQVLRLCVGNSFEGRLPSGELCTLFVVERTKNRIVLQRIENCETDKTALKSNCADSTGSTGSTIKGGMNAALVAQNETSCFLPNGSCCGYGAAIWLLQCMPKASKVDDIVRQCTEIGVEKIFLVNSDRSVSESKKNSGLKIERWNRIIKEARQQSASPVNTVLHEPLAMKDMLKTLKICLEERYAITGKEPVLLVLTEAPLEAKSLHGLVAGKPSTVVVAVGAEGGISPAELKMLKEFGFEMLHFSTNVLRSETAAIYGVSTVQSIMTEFDLWLYKE